MPSGGVPIPGQTGSSSASRGAQSQGGQEQQGDVAASGDSGRSGSPDGDLTPGSGDERDMGEFPSGEAPGQEASEGTAEAEGNGPEAGESTASAGDSGVAGDGAQPGFEDAGFEGPGGSDALPSMEDIEPAIAGAGGSQSQNSGDGSLEGTAGGAGGNSGVDVSVNGIPGIPSIPGLPGVPIPGLPGSGSADSGGDGQTGTGTQNGQGGFPGTGQGTFPGSVPGTGQGGFPGSGQGTGSNGPLTPAEQVAILDAELERGMGDFDAMILEEQAAQRQASRESTTNTPIETASAEGVAGGAGDAEGDFGREIGGGSYSVGGGFGGARGGGSIPENTPRFPPPSDIPNGNDDDVVARQLREAAMREPDPEVREKLWAEYRKYKGIKQP